MCRSLSAIRYDTNSLRLIASITLCQKRNKMLSNVRQHNCYITQSSYIGYMFRLLISHFQVHFNRFSHTILCTITQSSYIGYMFRLLISHLQAYFNRFSHKVLCSHWDPSVFTSTEYIKLDHLLCTSLYLRLHLPFDC